MRNFQKNNQISVNKTYRRKISFAVFALLVSGLARYGAQNAFAVDGSGSATTETPQLTAEQIAAQQEAQAAADAAAKAAAQAAELQAQIAQKNADLAEIQNQIDTYQKWLNSAQDESNTLQSTIATLNVERQKMMANISKTQNRLASTQLEIQRLGLGIAEAGNNIQVSINSIAEVLREIDQTDSRTLVETVLSKKKLSDILDERIQLDSLRDKINQHVLDLKRNKDALTSQKSQLEGDSKKLVVYRATLVDQKAVLDNAKKEKNDVLIATKNRESDYQKILNENLAKKQQFEKDLAAYEAKITRQLTAQQIPTTQEHSLLWPLDDPAITQEFGTTKDSVRLYASGTHNGIDLRANRGTPVHSPGPGVVVDIGDTDNACPKASYGKWILIKHSNGLSTLMSHFDLIKVVPGQEIGTGDLLGYSGNTGYTTGPHLHITVFASDGVVVGKLPSKSCPGKMFTMPLLTAKNAYLDPEVYFPVLSGGHQQSQSTD